MNRALLFLIPLVIGCGDGGDSGLGGAGGSAQVVCPEVTPGEDEILVPEDRDRMITACGSECFPFFGQVRRDSDDCVDRMVAPGGEALCLPLWTADCRAADLRLEFVGCGSNAILEQPIEIFDGFAECWVHVDDGTIVIVGSNFWPLGEEVWRPCSAAELEGIFCN